jgi:soluble lytic murein transglycosylase-like protein
LVLDNVSGAGERITSSIQSASQTTGIGFQYLMQTAARESDFNPSARASTSSARGLFQFIESTWLGTMKEAGPFWLASAGKEKPATAIIRLWTAIA